MKKALLAIAIMLGLNQIAIAKSDFAFDSAKSLANKHEGNCTTVCQKNSPFDPTLIALLSKTLSNLDKTTNTGNGFDYWPNGGMQIAYYHLATFISYKAIANLSPYPIFKSGPHGTVSLNLNSSQTFGHYNPQFLQWFQDHLSAILEDRGFIEVTRGNFQTYLGDTLRTYRATYVALNQYPQE